MQRQLFDLPDFSFWDVMFLFAMIVLFLLIGYYRKPK